MNREQRQNLSYWLMSGIVLGAIALTFVNSRSFHHRKPVAVAKVVPNSRPHGVLPAYWRNAPRAPASIIPQRKPMVASIMDPALFSNEGPLKLLSVNQRQVAQRNILQSVDRRIRMGQISPDQRQRYIKLSVMDLSLRLLARQGRHTR